MDLVRRAQFLTLLSCLMLATLLSCKGRTEAVQFYHEDFPLKLSAWQIYRGRQARLQPNARVIPYDLNTALFTDYAHKYRTVYVPEGKAAQYSEKKALDLPIGSVISKTFMYRKDTVKDLAGLLARMQRKTKLKAARARAELAPIAKQPEKKSISPYQAGNADSTYVLLETRLLVHTADGWVGLPYLWNADQTEAYYMPAGGLYEFTYLHQVDAAPREFNLNYAIPDQNQCASCHITKDGGQSGQDIIPIGIQVRHINKTMIYLKDTGINQLEEWYKQGILINLAPAKSRPANVNYQDRSARLEDRAHAYLDANCAHCHRAEGPARTSGLRLPVFETDLTARGRCKTPVAAGRGSGGYDFDLNPGKPQESILMFRMLSEDPGIMMPELGRSVVHVESIALMRQWIGAMPGKCK